MTQLLEDLPGTPVTRGTLWYTGHTGWSGSDVSIFLSWTSKRYRLIKGCPKSLRLSTHSVVHVPVSESKHNCQVLCRSYQVQQNDPGSRRGSPFLAGSLPCQIPCWFPISHARFSSASGSRCISACAVPPGYRLAVWSLSKSVAA